MSVFGGRFGGGKSNVSPSSIGDGNVDRREFNFLDGIASNIQDQLNARHKSVLKAQKVQITSSMTYLGSYYGFRFYTDEFNSSTIRIHMRNYSGDKVYLSMITGSISSAGSSEGGYSSTASRNVIDTNTGSYWLLKPTHSTSAITELKMIMSAYGGSAIEPTLVTLTAVRHDSNDILVIIEAKQGDL